MVASVLALLKSDQQRLFRRTQVRQILARLRDQGDPPYLDNLREVMDSPDVRYLVKDAVAAWLGSVDSPTPAEVQIVRVGWDAGKCLNALRIRLWAARVGFPRSFTPAHSRA